MWNIIDIIDPAMSMHMSMRSKPGPCFAGFVNNSRPVKCSSFGVYNSGCIRLSASPDRCGKMFWYSHADIHELLFSNILEFCSDFFFQKIMNFHLFISMNNVNISHCRAVWLSGTLPPIPNIPDSIPASVDIFNKIYPTDSDRSEENLRYRRYPESETRDLSRRPPLMPCRASNFKTLPAW